MAKAIIETNVFPTRKAVIEFIEENYLSRTQRKVHRLRRQKNEFNDIAEIIKSNQRQKKDIDDVINGSNMCKIYQDAERKVEKYMEFAEFINPLLQKTSYYSLSDNN